MSRANAVSEGQPVAFTRRLTLPNFPPGWHCYLLLCEGGSFYCGIASDLRQRLLHHASGKGSKYTKKLSPVALIWCECHETRASAASRESEIKGWSHAKKQALVDSGVWVSLAARLGDSR